MAPLTFPVPPGKKITLADYDPRYSADLRREEAEAAFPEITNKIKELQELLYSAGDHALLIILQGMDTSGKDGTIRHVFGQVDPLGINVASFKPPTSQELAHDFLWRIHQHAPGRGEVTIFNRSHYEDVLVGRVRSLVPEKVWKRRYRMINDFEHILTDNDTIILKFFLHISKQEQEKRLLSREQEVTKAWKLAVSDWKEREYWDDYQRAYEETLSRCSTEEAPWQIVPADRKWYRNYAIASSIVAALEPYRKRWFTRLEELGRRARADLEAFRASLPPAPPPPDPR